MAGTFHCTGCATEITKDDVVDNDHLCDTCRRDKNRDIRELENRIKIAERYGTPVSTAWGDQHLRNINLKYLKFESMDAVHKE